jgi:glutathione S-transferase
MMADGKDTMTTMKLLYAPTSPFVRKVMVVAHLTGQADQIEWLPSAAHPIRRDDRIAAHNPLAKVPTLILEDGQSLYDSRVICEYLAVRAGDTQLFPASGAARWHALTQQALGDGLLDAALLARYERTARPAGLEWTDWYDAQLVKVEAGLAAIENQASALSLNAPTLDASTLNAPTIGDITLGCALGYLDFRFPEFDWPARYPDTARWHAAFRTLPAMQATLPHDA